MQIVNKTNNQVFYSTQAPGVGDCGNLNVGESVYLPYETKWGPFTVSMSAVQSGQTGGNSFTFDNVSPGAVVTLAAMTEF